MIKTLSKRFAALLATALAALLLFSVPAAATSLPPADESAAASGEAAEITQGLTLSHSGGQGADTLLDRNRSSKLTLAAGDTIDIQSESPFTWLYFIWDQPPPACTLEAGGQSISIGQQGYLHEAVMLNAPAEEAQLTLGEDSSILCDIYLFEAGTPPTWVQLWQPMLEKADLVAFSTHADDEHLFFGGILPTYAGERGLAVQVVYLTNHWGEPYRPHELLDGLWTVGVTAYPVIGPFPDLYASKESYASAEATFGYDAVLEFQVEMLRRFKPFVAVGHDLNGEYGHGAHMLNAATLVDALELSGDESQYPELAAQYGVWDVPKTYLHLYAENELVMDWNIPLQRFGGATAFEMAEAGFAKHTSQVSYFSVQQGGTWEDCRKFGLVRSTVGPDVSKDDLFENIDLAPEPEPEPEPESLPQEAASAPASSPDASSAVSTPDAASGSTAASPGGSGTLLFILIGAVLLLAILIALLVLINRKGRHRR